MTLRFLVGNDESGQPFYADLVDLPHLLVAGTTGSGKSVFIHSLMYDLIQNSDCRFMLFDPKRVELSAYSGMARLMKQPVVNVEESAVLLRGAMALMDTRFRLLQSKGLRDWGDLEPSLPRLVIVIDELANLILADKTVEKPLVTLASQGRAAGIHLVVATQRPSADVLTGLLRANVPSRVALAVVTAMDSRVILDDFGAEKLKGKGDLLFRHGTQLVHLQGRFVPDKETNRVTRSAA